MVHSQLDMLNSKGTPEPTAEYCASSTPFWMSLSPHAGWLANTGCSPGPRAVSGVMTWPLA